METAEKINLYTYKSQILTDAIDRIVVEVRNKRVNYSCAQSILLTGCGPQSGTTSTCIGLGIAFAAAKWKTIIVDCDIRKSYELKKLNQGIEKGLDGYLLGDNVLDIKDTIYQTNIENLSIIPCGEYTDTPTRLFCSERMIQVLDYVRKEYDYVIFDFPSLTVVPDAQILFNYVDGIILMSSLLGITKKQVKEAKRKIRPYSEKYYGMIVNKVEMPLYKKYIKNFDYYFINKKGYQKLDHNAAKKYKKKAAREAMKIDA